MSGRTSSPSANARISSSVSPGRCRPGSVGTPAAAAASFALTLSPSASIASGGGPMNVTPASAQARAKAAFSLRKP